MDTKQELKLMWINGYRYFYTGQDDCYSCFGMPDYVVKNGKAYEIVDPANYMKTLQWEGSTTYSAKKTGNILIQDYSEGDKFTTYTSNGNEEVAEVVNKGSFVVARADENGRPVIDSFGHMNMWQVKEETLRKRYADVPEEIKSGMVFSPAGEPQIFVQVHKDIAVLEPWGENGRPIPQTIDSGGYLTRASSSDYPYGIAKEEFEATYKILEDKTNDSKYIAQVKLAIAYLSEAATEKTSSDADRDVNDSKDEDDLGLD